MATVRSVLLLVVILPMLGSCRSEEKHKFFSASDLGAADGCTFVSAVGPDHLTRTLRRELFDLDANLLVMLDFGSNTGLGFRCPDALIDPMFAGERDPDVDLPTAEANKLLDQAAKKMPPPTGARWRNACRSGDARACLTYASRYAQGGLGAGTEQKNHFARACELGLALGCFMKARTVNDERPDRAAGMAVLDQACAGGDARACFDAFAIYDRGAGVPRDGAKAKAFRQKACALKYRYGCAK